MPVATAVKHILSPIFGPVKESLSIKWISVPLCQMMQINPQASEVSRLPAQKLEPWLGILKSSLSVTNVVQGLCKFHFFGLSF